MASFTNSLISLNNIFDKLAVVTFAWKNPAPVNFDNAAAGEKFNVN